MVLMGERGKFQDSPCIVLIGVGRGKFQESACMVLIGSDESFKRVPVWRVSRGHLYRKSQEGASTYGEFQEGACKKSLKRTPI